MFATCACGCWVRTGTACPTCGRAPLPPTRSAAALLLGLGLVAGCPESQADYGVMTTDPGDTDTDTDTDSDSGDTGQ